VTILAKDQLPFVLIGGGSNLVISDHDLNCYVIRYFTPEPLIQIDGTTVIVSGSTALDDLVAAVLRQSLEGLNYASGIPGTVGGAIVGNAGAWGKQVGDVLQSVVLLNRFGERGIVYARDLDFTYRNSNLKQTDEIVVSAIFQLKPCDKQALQKERDDILKTRHEKHPDLQAYPCAGSFFRNIEPTSKAQHRQASGHFLEQAGAKSMKIGGAAVYDKHANIIIKTPGCKSQDVYELSKQMAKAVKDKFGLNLVREVRLVGKFYGGDSQNIMW
ncbi:MAG: UDP-N-acetylenolpyruvoylglucosamine reductase, partial [Candidatus Omnitrophica bacterium CG12_big_fil_rev_8_21_14_0_65_50_5]